MLSLIQLPVTIKSSRTMTSPQWFNKTVLVSKLTTTFNLSTILWSKIPHKLSNPIPNRITGWRLAQIELSGQLVRGAWLVKEAELAEFRPTPLPRWSTSLGRCRIAHHLRNACYPRVDRRTPIQWIIIRSRAVSKAWSWQPVLSISQVC